MNTFSRILMVAAVSIFILAGLHVLSSNSAILAGDRAWAFSFIHPVAGESVKGGATYTVEWSSPGLYTYPLVYYSTDNGSTWHGLSSTAKLSYPWAVPSNIYSSTCQLMAVYTGWDTYYSGIFSIYGPPTISSISPTSGPVGTTVTINSSSKFGNATGLNVTFGNVNASNISFKSSSKITATVPASLTPGTYTVKVTNPGGASATYKSFTVTSSPTYSISGSISGVGLEPLNRAITLSGAASGTTLTDASGNYSFSGLANGIYTVTPPTLPGATVSPLNLAVTINGASQAGINFTYSLTHSISISGDITGYTGSVIVYLSGDASSSQTITSPGSYSFGGLNGGTYTVSTETKTGYNVSPSSRNMTISNDITGRDFTYTQITTTYSISGKVTEADGTTGISGVTVADGTRSSIPTGLDGNYTISGVPAGTYTLTASKAGYAFTASGFTNPVTVSTSDLTGKNFTGTTIFYSISGKVTEADGTTGISGVTVSDGTRSSTPTGTDGTYTITNVPAGTYALTASKPEWTFVPATQSVTVGPDATNVSFTGTGITYSVSGIVTLQGTTDSSGVTVSDGTISAVTAADGTYTIVDVPAGTYTLTASKDGWTFDPATQSVTVGPDAAGINFTGTEITYSVSGQVLGLRPRDLSNGVTITIESVVPMTVVTSQIDFTFNDVLPGTHTITPQALDGYSVTPESVTVTVGASNVSGIVFQYSKIITQSVPGTFNHPNPFNPNKENTIIEFELTSPAKVGVYIFDLGARLVWKQEKTLSVGQVIWNGEDFLGRTAGNGVYLVRVVNLDDQKMIGKCKIFVVK